MLLEGSETLLSTLLLDFASLFMHFDHHDYPNYPDQQVCSVDLDQTAAKGVV